MFARHVLQWLSQAGASRTDAVSTLMVFISVLAVVRIFQWVRRIRSLPPGPWGVPILGYLPFLNGKAVHLHYAELAKKYGSMFSTKLGTHLVVVLSDYRAIRESFRREEFTGRPHTEFNNILGGYGKFQIIEFLLHIGAHGLIVQVEGLKCRVSSLFTQLSLFKFSAVLLRIERHFKSKTAHWWHPFETLAKVEEAVFNDWGEGSVWGDNRLEGSVQIK